MNLNFPEWYLLLGALVIVAVWFAVQAFVRSRARNQRQRPLTPEEAKREADKLIEKVRRGKVKRGKVRGADLE